MKMDLHLSLTWMLLLSTSLLCEPGTVSTFFHAYMEMLRTEFITDIAWPAGKWWQSLLMYCWQALFDGIVGLICLLNQILAL